MSDAALQRIRDTCVVPQESLVASALRRWHERRGDTWIPRRRLPRCAMPGEYVQTAHGFVAHPFSGLPEWGIACALRRLMAYPIQPLRCDTHGLGADQVDAVEMASGWRAVTVITGGPGTGKSTCVRRVVDAAIDAGLFVVQVAPTAMAARRLVQTTGHPASTIQSWLMKRRGHVDLLVCDEGSMVGVALADKMLGDLLPGCRIIIMGDANQLPSIDPGYVLCDLIDSGRVPVTHLRQVFRFEPGGPIASACQDVLDGRLPRAGARGREGFHYINKSLARFSECTEHAIKLLGITIYECRTLCATRKDAWTANERIKRAFNPGSAHAWKRFSARGCKGGKFDSGDPVRQGINDYNAGIVNGDVGIVRPGGIVEFPHISIREEHCTLSLAYASTVHSAQGCEYPYVGIYLSRRAGDMLTREVLLTALSRGQRLVLLICDKQHLAEILSRVTPRRLTRLREFLRGEDYIT